MNPIIWQFVGDVSANQRGTGHPYCQAYYVDYPLHAVQPEGTKKKPQVHSAPYSEMGTILAEKWRTQRLHRVDW